MKKTIGLLMLAITLALGPAAAVQAADAPQRHDSKVANARFGTGYFTVSNVTLPATGGCFDHPHRLDVNIGFETDGWFVAVDINGPKGPVDSWVSQTYFADWGASYFEESAFICSSLDGPGTYTITGTLYTCLLYTSPSPRD